MTFFVHSPENLSSQIFEESPIPESVLNLLISNKRVHKLKLFKLFKKQPESLISGKAVHS
jgi:hypothetical protein